MTAVEIATGYVTLQLSARGLVRDLRREVAGVEQAAARAGRDAGAAMGEQLGEGVQRTNLRGKLSEIVRDPRLVQQADTAGRLVGKSLVGGVEREAARLELGSKLKRAITDPGNVALAGRAGEAVGQALGGGVNRAVQATARGTLSSMGLGRLSAGARRAGADAGESYSKGFEQQASKGGGRLRDAMFGGAAFGAAGVAISGITSSLSGFIGAAITASDATDKFKQTLGFAGLGAKQIDQLTKSSQAYADKTVYELSDIQNVTAQLAANSVKDFDKLAVAAGNLNAVAGGNAETFKSVGMVLTQTAGAGKLTTENWNQLSDAIPGASGKLQEALLKAGAYTGNFRDAMEKGQISAEEFNTAVMQLGMTDVAQKAATSTKTIEGAWGNLQASLNGGLAQLVTTLKPAITGVFNGLAQAAGPVFATLNAGLKQLIGFVQVVAQSPAFAALKASLSGIGRAFAGQEGGVSRFRTVVAQLQVWLQGSFLPAVRGVVQGFQVAWARLAPIVAAFATQFWQRIQPLLPQVRGIFGQIGQVITGALGVVKAVVGAVTRAIQVIWRNWGATILNFAATTFRNVLTTIRGVLNVILGVFKVVTGLLTGNWRGAWAGIKQITSGALTVIKGVVSQALNVIKSAFSVFKTGVSNLWSAMWTGIKNGASGAMDWVKGNLKRGLDTVKSGFSNAVTAIGKTWDGLQAKARQPVDYVINTVINKGLVGNFNKIGKPFGVTLPSVAFAEGGVFQAPKSYGFASGGILPGYTPGRDVYNFVDQRKRIKLALSGGEGILRPEITKLLGERGIAMLNNAAKRGRGAMLSALDSMSHVAFAEGGVFRTEAFAGGGVFGGSGSWTKRFEQAMLMASKIAGFAFSVSQRGFRPATSYSGTSHQGDAVDVVGGGPFGRIVAALRAVGIAAWDRTGKGNWAPHVHGVPLPGVGQAGGSAIWQAQDYLRGGDGLGGRDNGPRIGVSGKIIAGLSAISDKIRTVAGKIEVDFGSVLDPVRNMMAKVADNPLGQLAKGIATKTMDAIKEKGSSLLGFATGGHLRGPGTGTSDSMIIRASNGEYMLRKWAVDRIGVARLNFMNQFGSLPAFATGGLVGKTAAGVSAIAPSDWVTLVGALRAMQQALAANTAAQRAAAPGKAAVQRANVTYTRALDRKKALNSAQVAEDIAWQARINAAKAKPSQSKVQKLQDAQRAANLAFQEKILIAQGKRKPVGKSALQKLQEQRSSADLSYDKQIAAARRLGKKGEATVKRLQQQAQATDLSYRSKIERAKAGQSVKVSVSEVQRLQRAQKAQNIAFEKQIAAAKKNGGSVTALQKLQQQKAAVDLRQKRDMASATKAVDAAQKALAKTQIAAKPATDKASQAAELYKQRQQALAEQQQKVIDSARQLSSSLQDNYQWGFNPNDWVLQMTAGVRELDAFNVKLGRLRQLRLDESLVQQIAGKGVSEGGFMADQIIRGGVKEVDRLDRASAALRKAADRLAMTQVGAVESPAGRVAAAGTVINIKGVVQDQNALARTLQLEQQKAQIVSGIRFV